MTPDQFNTLINLIQTGAAGAKEMFIWWLVLEKLPGFVGWLATLTAGVGALWLSLRWGTARSERANTLARIAEILSVNVSKPYYQDDLRRIVAAVEKLKGED